MKIAQISPLYESVPPQLYGGTERVVHWLTEELVAQGHEVVLFASADSRTSARLVPCCERALRLDESCVDPIAHHVVMLERLISMLDEEQFDVLHFHVDYLHFPLLKRVVSRHLTTLHGRLDIADLEPLYRTFPDAPVISISESQRLPLPWLSWKGTVLHGMPLDLLRPNLRRGQYLAFLRRLPEKRPDVAIQAAVEAGLPIKLAAKIEKKDMEYFEAIVRPLLDLPGVEYVGEVNEREKQEFLGNAMATLFPIDWPEPFGLVMIESMACGTPVIACRNGSVDEVMKAGISGFVVDSPAELAQAVARIDEVSRAGCRAYFERRFSARRMAQDYVRVYRTLVPQNGQARHIELEAQPH